MTKKLTKKQTKQILFDEIVFIIKYWLISNHLNNDGKIYFYSKKYAIEKISSKIEYNISKLQKENKIGNVIDVEPFFVQTLIDELNIDITKYFISEIENSVQPNNTILNTTLLE